MTPVQESVSLSQLAELIGGWLATDQTAEAIARFRRLRPADRADVIIHLEERSRTELLAMLSVEEVAEIICELYPEQAAEISKGFEVAHLATILDETDHDVAADVLRNLDEAVATETLSLMTVSSDVAPLLDYEDDDAGGLMTPDLIALRESMTVTQAMGFVRSAAANLDPNDISYMFVVDYQNVLKGGITLAQLVLAEPFQHISLLMDTDVFSVQADTDQEQCARIMDRYNLSSLAVVDAENRLVGTLRLEDMIGVVDDEATEDMYRMIGVDEGERAAGPFWRSVRSRLPWLCVNLATAVLAGLVVMLFQSTVAQAIALAAFLPVIAGQGGIAGTQTLTLIVRSIALGEISDRNTSRLIWKEAGLGMVHGLVLALIVGVVAFVWQGNTFLALVVAVAMLGNLIIAGISGVLVPLGFRALRIDPALASAVAVTTVTDVMGFLIYLGLATLMIALIAGSA
jgi:magnesium transporter